MFDFSFGQNIFLGIDIGTSSIKMVELRLSGNRPFLSNYAWINLPDNDGKYESNSEFFNELVPLYLKVMVQEAKLKGKRAYVSLPAYEGLITLIDFPEMAKNEIEQAIRYEAHKYIPTSLEDVVLSWDIISHNSEANSGKTSLKDKEENELDEKKSADGKMQVLLVAASRNKVNTYEKIIKNAHLELKAIELESFSLVSSLIGNDPGNFVIIDIGSRVCNILLVEKGIIKANRNIDAGGKNLTKMIAKSMGIDDSRAEKMKTSGKDFFAIGSNMNFPSLEAVSNEASRMIDAYYKNQNSKINNIILSGGTAQLAGITEYFENLLNIKTIIGNPFSRLDYNAKLNPILLKLSGRFSVSLGLALKGVDEYLNKK